MKRDMLRKIAIVTVIFFIAVSLAACGGGGSGEGESSGIDPEATLSVERYEELLAEEWYSMSYEEIQEFMGVAGVVDEEGTADWGEGYLVVDFPGPNEDSYVHGLFKEDEEGILKVSSLSGTGAFNQ